MNKMFKLVLNNKCLTFLKSMVSKEDPFDSYPSEKLLARMRHDAHRIEKTQYNNIFYEKYSIYKNKYKNIQKIQEILINRGIPYDEPTIVWAGKICEAFEDLEKKFIRPNSKPAPIIKNESITDFITFLSSRRSVRVWNSDQPEGPELENLAKKLIDAARWSPTSGNRQPWRFKIIHQAEQKNLLKGIKEKHCITAPLLIFMGMDSRVYGALGDDERSIYIDAGAASCQMVLAAHSAGYGVCWNHFADDLINSRSKNIKTYKVFSNQLNIPNYITPIAIIAVGKPAFIPPTPARMDIESLIL